MSSSTMQRSIPTHHIEDEPMEHVYLMALLARNSGQKKIPVHVFPSRMDSLNCRATLATASEMKPERKAHWRGLFPGYRAFESTRIPPRIQARRNGQYRLHPLSVSHVESN